MSLEGQGRGGVIACTRVLTLERDKTGRGHEVKRLETKRGGCKREGDTLIDIGLQMSDMPVWPVRLCTVLYSM